MLPMFAGKVLPVMLAELADVPSLMPVSALFALLDELGRLSPFSLLSSLLKNRFNREVTVFTRDIVPATVCIDACDDPLAFLFRPLAEK